MKFATAILPLIATLALAGTGSSLQSQAIAPLGVHVVDTSSGPSPAIPDRTFYLRAAPAAVLGFSSFVIGGFGAYVALGDECYECGGNVRTFMTVASVAGIFGTAMGASMLEGRGLCTFGERFRRSLVGTVLGAAAGLALLETDPLQHSIFATVPIGSVMFLRRC